MSSPKTAKDCVVQCGHYSYFTNLEVKVGDRVRVTVSPVFRDIFGSTSETTVTSLDQKGDYPGPFQNIIAVL